MISIRNEREIDLLRQAGRIVMEALQLVGYLVINQCDNPINQAVTLLSILHIVFQPFFINAFTLELVSPAMRAKTSV